MYQRDAAKMEAWVENYLNKKNNVPSEVVVHLVFATQWLFFEKNWNWTLKKIHEISDGGNGLEKLRCVGGLVKIITEQAISEDRKITYKEWHDVACAFAEAIEILRREVVERHETGVFAEEKFKHFKFVIDSLFILSRAYIPVIFEIAFEIYGPSPMYLGVN